MLSPAHSRNKSNNSMLLVLNIFMCVVPRNLPPNAGSSRSIYVAGPTVRVGLEFSAAMKARRFLGNVLFQHITRLVRPATVPVSEQVSVTASAGPTLRRDGTCCKPGL